MIELSIGSLLAALGIPTALTGFFFWIIQRKIEKRDKQLEEQEKMRRKNEVLVIKSVNAAIKLGEAAALALKNGHTNGETEAALECARKVSQEQEDFLTSQGISAIY